MCVDQYFDWAQVFDMINYVTFFVHKMKNICITGSDLVMFSFYFGKRKQSVEINRALSDAMGIK